MLSQPPEHEAPEWLRYAVQETLPEAGVTTWIPTDDFETSALRRVPRYPGSIGDDESRAVSLTAARNERRSAQLAVAATRPIEDLSATVSSLDGPGGASIPGAASSVRYPGYLPAEECLPGIGGYPTVGEIAGTGLSGDRAPDVVADPLLEGEAIDVPSHRAQGVWLTVDVPAVVDAGEYAGEIEIVHGDEATTYDLTMTVRDVTVPEPAGSRYHLDVWFNPDAVAAEHGVEPWSEDHWSLLDAYFDDLAGARQRTIAVPIVHEPWQRPWLDGEWRSQTETGFSSMVEWHYDGSWSFDFDRFDRYVRAARDRGVGPTISAYSMLMFRAPQRLSYVDGDGEFVVERLEAGEDRWVSAWTAFLEAFADHLDERGWREQTYLAFDERPEEEMQEALAVVEDVVPEFLDRIQIAGSESVAELATDLSLHYNHFPPDEELIAQRHADGLTTTFYGAYPVEHPRTLSYSPAVESRIVSWIAAAHDLDGWLRWSYNSWPHDVFENPVFRYPQGSEYFVYPGEEGPLSSIRWELLREGIGEFELLQQVEDDAERTAIAELGARQPDGREKDLADVAAAREQLFEILE